MSLAQLVRPIACAAALQLATPLSVARAQSACDGHAVKLSIELEPPSPALQAKLERQLRVELGVHDLQVCERVPWLAQVRVQARPPELGRAQLQIRTSAGAVAQRELDLTGLPSAARPSAIASASDELLAALLGAPAAPAPVAAAAPPAPASDRAATPAPSHERAPTWALGVGGDAALFRDATQNIGGDVRVRVWLLPSLALTASVGAAVGRHSLPGSDLDEGNSPASAAAPVSESPALPDAVSTNARYAQLDASIEAFVVAPWSLAVQAGARLARSSLQLEYDRSSATRQVGFDAGRSGLDGGLELSDFAGPPRSEHIWDVLGCTGLEGRWQAGPWGVSTSLLALLPVFSSHSEDLKLTNGFHTPRVGLGAHLGAELRLGAWYAFGGD